MCEPVQEDREKSDEDNQNSVKTMHRSEKNYRYLSSRREQRKEILQ